MTQRQLVARTATVLGLIILAWILIWFVRQTTDILILLLVASILAAGLSPLVGFLERWRLPGGTRLSRGVAIFLLYLAVFGLIALILSIIVVPAVGEARTFLTNLPDSLARLQGWFADLKQRYPWLPDLASVLNRLPQQLASISQYGTAAAGAVFRFLGGFASIVTILVFTFYMLLQGAEIEQAFLALFPPRERPRVSRVLHRIGAKFGGWLRGQLLLSSIVAGGVAAGLLVLRMPYPFLLGIIAGIGELIPMVGTSLGAAVAVLVALSQPLWKLIAVLIFYAIVMNVEPHILAPRIMAQVVGMSPILILVALLSGIRLMGILGGLLAVPIAAAIQVIAAEVAQEIQPDGTPPQQ